MDNRTEFNLRILITPETERMTALYTVSRDNVPLCIDLPLDQALRHIRVELEDTASLQATSATSSASESH